MTDADLETAVRDVVRQVSAAAGGHPGVAVWSGHEQDGVTGGSLRLVEPAAVAAREALGSIRAPRLRPLLPGGPVTRQLTIEVQTQPNGWWKAVLCWADDLDSFTDLVRVVREATEPPLPQPVPDVDLDERLLSERWAAAVPHVDAAPPADPSRLDAAETRLGLPLPTALRRLLALADGFRIRLGADEEADGARPRLFRHQDLLSLDQLVDAHRADRAAARDPLSPLDHPVSAWALAGVVAPFALHPARVPFAVDGGGNVLVLDLAPGPAGRVGQVLEQGPDLTDGPELVAHSLDDLLRGVAPERPPARPRRLVVDLRKEPASALDPARVQPEAVDVAVWGVGHLETALLAPCRRLDRLGTQAGTVDLAGLAALPVRELSLTISDGVDLSPLTGPLTVIGVEALARVPRLERLRLPLAGWTAVGTALRDHPALLVAEYPSSEAPLDHVLHLAAAFDRPGRVLADRVLVLGPGSG